MDFTSSNRRVKIHKAKRLGDPEVINGFFNSPFWRMLRRKPKAGIAFLIGQIFKAHAAIMGYLFKTVTSTKPGILVSGLIVTFIGSLFITMYNSVHVWQFFYTLLHFTLPDISIWKLWDWDKVYQIVLIDVNSKILVGFNILFFALSMFNTVRNWLGYSPADTKHRGTSFLYLLCRRLFSKYVTVGEFFIGFLETILVIALGIYLVRKQIDVYFGFFVIGIACHNLIIIMKDRTAQLHHQPFIK